MNLREWSEKYLEIYKKPFIKYSTYSRYRCCLNDIPEIALDQIDVIDLQLIINSMMSRKKSVSSIKQVKILVLQALRRAHMLGYTENIDFTMIDMPKTKKLIYGRSRKMNSLKLSTTHINHITAICSLPCCIPGAGSASLLPSNGLMSILGAAF